MGAGTYVVVTNRPGGGEPVLRQVLTLDPGVTYTLALFSAAESNQFALQLAPDGPPTGPAPDSAVRMLHAAGAAGSVYLALVASGVVEPMVLANQAGYGLITGYAAVPAGRYEAVVSAKGREWRQPVEFFGGEPMSLLLTDGPDGPLLRTLRDVAEAPTALNPPTLRMPASGSVVDTTKARTPAIERWDGRRIAFVLCVVAIMGAAVLMARARPTRRQRQQNDAALHEAVRARGHGGEVVRRGRPVDDTARLPRGAVKPPVPPWRQRQPNDAARHNAVRARAHWREVIHRARPVDDTARLDLNVDTTARLDLNVDSTARLDLDVDNTARLDLDVDNTARLDLDVDNTARLTRGAVRPPIPPRRQRQQNDAALHDAVRARAHWREVVRRARPGDDTARLDLDVDNSPNDPPEALVTARLDLNVDNTARLPRGAVKPSVLREPR